MARNTFSGHLGFVLAVAGSAVGLGNIWRFPYLAAKNGGGLFLLVYMVLVFTFGFALLLTEVAIGRKTQYGPLSAYKLFFAIVFFAALTSCMSILEAIVASLIDEFKWTRKKATIVGSI